MRALIAGASLTALLLTPRPSAAGPGQAQASPPPRAYAGVSILLTGRPPGEQDYHYITPMLGGETVGVAGTVGLFLVPRLSVGVEVSRPGTLSGDLKFDHFLRTYSTASFDETLVGVFVRPHPMRSRARVEPVVSLTFSLERISLTNRIDLAGYGQNPKVTALPDVNSGLIRHVGVGGGADGVFDLGPRVAITASFRFAYFPGRYEVPLTYEANSVGLANRTFQAGAGLRWTFR